MSEEPLILIIEDQYLLQADLEQALTKAGFATELAYSAEEALSIFKDSGKNFKALITDVDLGSGLNGWEVARRIREIEPAFPVVYVTGSGADDWSAQGVPNSILVPKPFAPGQLVTAISSLLNVGGPTT